MKKNKTMAVISFCTLFLASTRFISYASGWEQKNGGWTYTNEDGTTPISEWKWIDNNGDTFARHYYFDENGMLVTDGVTPDGIGLVNSKGEELEGLLTPCYWKIRQSNPNPEDIVELNSWNGTYSLNHGQAYIKIDAINDYKKEPLRPRCSVNFTSEDSHPLGRELFGYFNDTNTELSCVHFMSKEQNPCERVVITRNADGSITLKVLEETYYMSFVEGNYKKINYYYGN